MAALRFNYLHAAVRKKKKIQLMQHFVVPMKGILFLFLASKSSYV